MRWDVAFTYQTKDAEAPFRLHLQHCWTAATTGIFGDSGSGKTTLLEVLLGLKAPARVAGYATCGQHALFATGRRHWPPPHQRRCAWVPQDAALMPHLTVAGNLQLSARRGADIAAMVDAVGLAPLLRKKPQQLSGGERQRVALARALLCPHQLLLLDEPLAALDDKQRFALLQLLRERPARLAVAALYVSHDWQDIGKLCDYVLVLAGGRLVAAGRPQDLQQLGVKAKS